MEGGGGRRLLLGGRDYMLFGECIGFLGILLGVNLVCSIGETIHANHLRSMLPDNTLPAPLIRVLTNAHATEDRVCKAGIVVIEHCQTLPV